MPRSDKIPLSYGSSTAATNVSVPGYISGVQNFNFPVKQFSFCRDHPFVFPNRMPTTKNRNPISVVLRGQPKKAGSGPGPGSIKDSMKRVAVRIGCRMAWDAGLGGRQHTAENQAATDSGVVLAPRT